MAIRSKRTSFLPPNCLASKKICFGRFSTGIVSSFFLQNISKIDFQASFVLNHLNLASSDVYYDFDISFNDYDQSNIYNDEFIMDPDEEVVAAAAAAGIGINEAGDFTESEQPLCYHNRRSNDNTILKGIDSTKNENQYVETINGRHLDNLNVAEEGKIGLRKGIDEAGLNLIHNERM